MKASTIELSNDEIQIIFGGNPKYCEEKILWQNPWFGFGGFVVVEIFAGLTAYILARKDRRNHPEIHQT